MTKYDQFISVAEGFFGCQTGDSRHQMLVRFYNQISPLPRGYKLQPRDAWCAAFISAVGYILGMVPDVIKPECGAHEMWRAYPAARQQAAAERGDLVFYDWNKDGLIDHVGIVCNASAGNLQVLEGNKDGAVSLRYIRDTDPAIYGYIRPDWGTEKLDRLYVDCDSLNLRAKPAMDAEVITEMAYRDSVEYLGSFDGWAEVKYLNTLGYCGEGYLTDAVPPDEGETTTALYLRKEPGTDKKILRVLPAGTIFHYNGDRSLIGSMIWERIYIEDGDLTGWVASKYVRPIS